MLTVPTTSEVAVSTRKWYRDDGVRVARRTAQSTAGRQSVAGSFPRWSSSRALNSRAPFPEGHRIPVKPPPARVVEDVPSSVAAAQPGMLLGERLRNAAFLWSGRARPSPSAFSQGTRKSPAIHRQLCARTLQRVPSQRGGAGRAGPALPLASLCAETLVTKTRAWAANASTEAHRRATDRERSMRQR
jgi:hypothetical protein